VVDQVDDGDRAAVAQPAERAVGLAPVEDSRSRLDALPPQRDAQVRHPCGQQVLEVVVPVLGVAGHVEGVDVDGGVVGALEARQERPPPRRERVENVVG
jgi:hypothetical protein